MPILLPGLLALHLQRDSASGRLAPSRCFVLRHEQVLREARNRNMEGNTFKKKKEVNTFNWKSALQEFCIVIYDDLLAGSRGKEERLVCQAVPRNQGFNVAMNKQEGAVLAHLKQIEEAYRLNQERHFLLFKIYEFLLLFVSSPKLYPPCTYFSWKFCLSLLK